MTSVGVVTTVRGRHDHLRRQRRSLALGGRRPDLHVVVAMDDPEVATVAEEEQLPTVVLPVAADPLGLPLARARNLGMSLAAARGCEVLVGLDVDCLAGAGLVEGYADAVRADPATVWSGPVTYLPPGAHDLDLLTSLDDPHPARPAPRPGVRRTGGDPDLFWSLSYAVAAGTWDAVGGFHEGYVGYGCEDTDLGRRIEARGRGLGWTGDARAYHQHHPVSDPPVEHLEALLRNGRTFHRRWGEWPARGWFEAFEELGLVRRAGEGWEAVPTGTVQDREHDTQHDTEHDTGREAGETGPRHHEREGTTWPTSSAR